MLIDTRTDRIYPPFPGATDPTLMVALEATFTGAHYVLPMVKVEGSLRGSPEVYRVSFTLVGDRALPSWGPVDRGTTPKTAKE